jgi:MFS family permease
MTAAAKSNPLKNAFRNPNFRLLWGGQVTSILGDQFSMIAMPWLVLKLTGSDPIALGTVLALGSVPRALFMLLGGAVTDRLSQRTVMLVSDVLRFALTGLLAALVLTGSVHLWMVYILSLLGGLVSSFFTPASSSIVPHILEPENVMGGNSVMQGSAQLSIFLGPVLAGALIAAFAGTAGGAGAAGNMQGTGVAFAFDALTFLVSAVTLWFMHVPRPRQAAGPRDNAGPAGAAATQPGLLASIKESLHFMSQDPVMRLVYILIAGVNLTFVGPLLVGIPVVADTRLAQGAAAFGMIMSAYGAGNLGGILIAGSLPKPKPGMLNAILVGLVAGFGVAIGLFAFFTTTLPFLICMLLLGIGNGYLGLSLITFIQTHTPREMLGRVMGMVLFANLGLVPVSQAISGFLIKLSLNGLFIGAGVLTVAIAAWMLFTPATRLIGMDMSEAPVKD